MKVELQDANPPAYWLELQRLIASDPHLRRDVTLQVKAGSIHFLDDCGREFPVALPQDLSESNLAEPNAQLRMLVWLWWNFGAETAVLQQRPSSHAA